MLVKKEPTRYLFEGSFQIKFSFESSSDETATVLLEDVKEEVLDTLDNYRGILIVEIVETPVTPVTPT